MTYEKYLLPDIIKLEHYQQHSANRNGYLAGLALDCYENPDNDRNSHYFGRELLMQGRPKSAMRELHRHIAMDKWRAEKAQSMVFVGDCYLALGNDNEAIRWWFIAYGEDGGRREPLVRLAEYYYRKKDAEQTAAFAVAMLHIQYTGYYGDNMAYYTYYPHEMLYWAKRWLGDFKSAKKHFDKAFEYLPNSPKYLAERIFFYPDEKPQPFVSIVIPTLGRAEQLAKLVKSIEENAEYQNYEVIIEPDSFTDRQGCPKTFKKGVARSNGQLVMFLGNDCICEQGFLRRAVDAMYRNFGIEMDGLIGLNDGYWKGELATHWLASKKLLPYLGGEFFHTGYHHVGCDNELTGMCKKIGKYAWAEDAKLFHDHPVNHGFDEKKMDEVHKLAWKQQMVEEDRALLKKRSELLGFEII